MAFKKKTSAVVETAKLRLSGMKSIDKSTDMGNGIGSADLENKIRDVESALENYNRLLSLADEAKNQFDGKEQELTDLQRRVMAGVGAVYGYDSNEYEKAGGTRKSDRKKPVKKVTEKV